MRNFLVVDGDTEAGGWWGQDGLHPVGAGASRGGQHTQSGNAIADR